MWKEIHRISTTARRKCQMRGKSMGHMPGVSEEISQFYEF